MSNRFRSLFSHHHVIHNHLQLLNCLAFTEKIIFIKIYKHPVLDANESEGFRMQSTIVLFDCDWRLYHDPSILSCRTCVYPILIITQPNSVNRVLG